MRTALLVCCLGGFLGLGVLDLSDGQVRFGVAGVCLFVANALLLTR